MLITATYLIACWLLAYFDGSGLLPSVLFVYQYIFAAISIIYFVVSKGKMNEALLTLALVLVVSFAIEYYHLVSKKEAVLGEFHSEAFAVYFFMTFLPSIVVYFLSFGLGKLVLSAVGVRSKG